MNVIKRDFNKGLRFTSLYHRLNADKMASKSDTINSQPKCPLIWQKFSKRPEPCLSRSKSQSIVSTHESEPHDKQVVNKQQARENLYQQRKRSHSSHGRLSSSDCDAPRSDHEENGQQADLHRSQSQPSIDQRVKKVDASQSHVESRQSRVDASQSRVERVERAPSLRKIRVNNKYYQILNCIGQGGSSKVILLLF